MRISEPGHRPRPMYVPPVAALAIGLVLGGVVGFGLFTTLTPKADAEKCVEVVEAANEILTIDERITMFYIASIKPDNKDSVDLRLKRNALAKNYNEIKGECQ